MATYTYAFTAFTNGFEGPNFNYKLLQDVTLGPYYSYYTNDCYNITFYFTQAITQSVLTTFISTYDPAVLIYPTTNNINICPFSTAVSASTPLTPQWTRVGLYAYDTSLFRMIKEIRVITAGVDSPTYRIRSTDTTNSNNQLGISGSINDTDYQLVETTLTSLTNIPVSSIANLDIQVSIDSMPGSTATVNIYNIVFVLANTVY